MKTRFESLRVSLFPKPVVVVTAVNGGGQTGATTIAWTGIVSSRPATISVSFLPDSFTRACILETREFVINVPDGRLVRQVNHLGSLSGPWESKLGSLPAGLAPLTLAASSEVRPPRISECYLNLECRVLRTVQIGLYDCFLGEVLTMHCDTVVHLADHPKGNINHSEVQPLFCIGDQYWAGGKPLGCSTENKNHPHGREH